MQRHSLYDKTSRQFFGYWADPIVSQQVIDGAYVPSSGTPIIVVNFLAAQKKKQI